MSREIDQRIVEMQFNNKQFENNVQTSMSSLDKLKKSLNLTGAAKGFDNLSASANKVDMSGLGGAVESVRMKFSALQVMAVTALSNITNSALNAGKRIVSALTIDPIKQGFGEYETKMNSIQTIMSNTASKGTTMKDVTKVIDELNTYADKTIYNFAEMTRNIGTFTAAGVGLEESAAAIQGIANLAAASGSSSQQASTAMYQLSQALSTGTVKLMDWNSVVNAGMGGEKFQEALKATAREHGIAIDQIIKDEGSFRDSLQKGWLSADILNQTLNKFTVDGAANYAKSMMESGKWTQAQADALMKEAQAMEDAATKVKTLTQLWDTLKEAAQSGWGKSWEIIIGDFDEAKSLFTEISDVIGGMIGASADARNEVLQGWKDLGGRTAVVEALRNTFEGIMSIVKPIKEAFSEIFPPITARQLAKFSEGLRDLTAKLKLSESTSAKLKSTFKGLFAVVDIVVTVFKEIAGGAIKLVSNFTGLGGGILGITGSFGNWISKLRDSIKNTDVLGKAIDGVVGFLQKGIDKLKEFGSALKSKISWPSFEGFFNFMQGLWDVVQKIGSKIAGVASKIGTAFAGIFRSGDINTGMDILNSGLFAMILLGVKKFIGTLTKITEGGKGMFDSLKDSFAGVAGILDGVQDSLKAWQANLKASILLKIAGAIALLTASVVVLSLIDPKKLAASLGAITVLFADLVIAMTVFNKIGGIFTGVSKSAVMMIAMSTAILILASALKKIADLDIKQLGIGLVGIAGLTTIVVLAAKAMSTNTGSVMKGALNMVLFASAIKVLASAVKDLAILNWNDLAKGLVGVTVLMAAVSAFLNTAKFQGKAIATATGMVILAASMKILASAVSDFAGMSWEDIGKGLSAIGILLGEIVLFTKLTANAQNVFSTGAALVVIAAAMKIFASAVQDFSGMSWDELGRGLLGMAGALAAVTIAVNLMPKNMIGIGAGLVVVATSMVILSKALGNMGGMSWSEIAKGLVALGGSMGILAIGLNLMNGTLPGSAALLVATASLAILTPVLKTLGKMSWGSIAKGLITIAGAFTVIGVAGLVLAPLVPAIMALAGAFALIGLGTIGLGVGLMAISAGFTALAAALSVSATAIVASLTVIVVGLLNLIPAVARAIGEGIIAFCEAIGNGTIAIASAIRAVVLSIIKVLVDCIPPLVDGLFKIVSGVLEGLAKYTPKIVESIMVFLIELIAGIAKKLPDLIGAGVDLVMAFFTGIVDALKSIDPKVLLQGFIGIGLLSAMMAALAAIAVLTPAALVGVIGMAAVITELAIVLAALGALSKIPGLTWFVQEGGNFLQLVGTAIGQFIGGMAGGIARGVTSAFPMIGTDLSNFMKNAKPFIDGAKEIDRKMMDGVTALAETILIITAGSIINGMASWLTGKSSIQEFSKQIVPFGKAIKQFADSVSGLDASAIAAASVAGKMLAEMADTIPNSGGVVGFFAGENDLGPFAKQVAAFGKAMKSFAESVSGIDPNSVTNAAIAGKALVELADSLPNTGGVVGWFEGDNNMDGFAKQLIPFGKAMKEFASAVAGIDPKSITNAAISGKALAELANSLPKQGGIGSWFSGENKISDFAAQLIPFGEAMKEFSLAVAGIDPKTIVNAATAGKALAELANTLPDQGGVVSWFAGDNQLDSFGDQLIPFGEAMKAFSSAVSGINPDAIQAAATAGKTLSELAHTLPDQGGVVSWFAGDNDMSTFGAQLIPFGEAMKAFSEAVSGIDPNTITSAATAGKTLAEMAKTLPEQGGFMNWFNGSSDMSTFGDQLIPFGEAMKAFSVAVAGINPEAIVAAATAGKSLSELAKNLPEQGGVASWFAGETDMSAFAAQLIPFGEAMKAFSLAVVGINPEAVAAAAASGKMLSEMAKNLPEQGGVMSWFSGSSDIVFFAEKLVPFGKAMKEFSTVVEGINPTSVGAAASAGKMLAELSNTLPKQGGMGDWFTGSSNIEVFASQLIPFGKAMKEFALAVAGIDQAAVTNATVAGKSLAELAKTLPEQGGMASWFSGENDIGKFGESLVTFGRHFAQYSNHMMNVDPSIVTSTTSAAKSVVELQKSLPKDGGWFSKDNSLASFGADLAHFGRYFSTYSASMATVNAAQLHSVINEIKNLISVAKGMSSLDTSAMSGFGKALTTLGQNGVNGFIKSFTNANSKVKTAANNMVNDAIKGANSKADELTSTFAKMVEKVITNLNSKSTSFKLAGSNLMTGFVTGLKLQMLSVDNAMTIMLTAVLNAIQKRYREFNSAGQAIMTNLITGVRSKDSSFKSIFVQMVSGTLTSIRNYYSDFSNAGAHLVNGFANGIDLNRYVATRAARAMAAAAAQAAKDQLKERSPSKVGYEIGDYFGIGFVNAILDMGKNAYGAGAEMASAAKNGLTTAVSKIASFIEDGIDTQPTIRPVLDLSNIESGTARLNTMLSRSQALAINAHMDNMVRGDQSQNETIETTPASNYQFIQNNYSPKALSRVEIYRQTKNQFASLKGLVKA